MSKLKGGYMIYNIREIQETEYAVLEEFLYQAIYIPEGTLPPERSILKEPALELYIQNFGKDKDDYGFVAEIEDKIVGAVWVRIMDDYGHVDDETPSFAISIFPEYRGQGIGTALMQRMLSHLRDKGYPRASLAVQKANAAFRLYSNLGFKIVDENEEEYIMVYHF